MSAESDEVGDGEWLLRRIPKLQGPTAKEPRPSHLSFRPHETRDVDGLSLYRQALVSPEELAAWGRTGKEYYVARVRASALREMGMQLDVAPDPSGKPGHVLISDLNSATRDSEVQVAWQIHLADICAVDGPFEGKS